MEETKASPCGQMILILQKGEIYSIVKFIYPFAPQTYYHRIGRLGIEMYVFDHFKGEIAFYKFVEPK